MGPCEEAVAVRLKAYIDNDAPDFMFQARRSFPRRLLGYFGPPAAKGTGVLINHGELQGILTCAHVDKRLRDLKQPVGLVRLNRGLAQQFGTVNTEEASEAW
jgi:hypothetical protein